MSLACGSAMARGWESKGIEAQQEEAMRATPRGPVPTAGDVQRQQRRQALQLARSRAAADLTRATAPAHRCMLEQAIASLDDQLAALNG